LIIGNLKIDFLETKDFDNNHRKRTISYVRVGWVFVKLVFNEIDFEFEVMWFIFGYCYSSSNILIVRFEVMWFIFGYCYSSSNILIVRFNIS